MEDDLKIWELEYLSHHWTDLTQIRNLRLLEITIVYKGIKWRQPPIIEDDLKWKMNSKYEKKNILATTGRILLKFETQAYGNKPKCPKV